MVESALSARERETLHAVALALLPALEPEPGDDPRLFAVDAARVGVPAALEDVIASLGAAQRDEMRTLLHLMDSRPFGMLLGGMPRSFNGMNPAARERALASMATSALPQLRTGFQALKRLSTFLFYSLHSDEPRANPTWPALDYRPIEPARARPLGFTPIVAEAPLTLEADVCIVGSGAGGGVVAAELAAAGMRVFVLEAGPGIEPAALTQLEADGTDALYLGRGTLSSTDLGVAVLAGTGVGGGTAINWQTSLRTPDDVRAEWVDLSGCAHFADDAFTRSLDAVCARLHVGVGETTVNANNHTIGRGAAALGWRCQVTARNARGCDAAQCGFCVYGCRQGGKQSVSVTFLEDADDTGNLLGVLTRCRVERVTTSGGRVTGVEATAVNPADGLRHSVTVSAPIVVVSAGALESPALLLRSGVSLPQLGRNLYLHPTTAVLGRYAEPVRGWDGPPQSLLCDEFAHVEGAYGVRIEAAPIHPGLGALATPWTSARQHRRRMQQLPNVSALVALVRDREGGHVTIDGEGRPVIHYAPGDLERDLLRLGMESLVRLHTAAGAEEVITLHTQPMIFEPRAGASIDTFCAEVRRAPVHANHSSLFSAHQMGTCRMGRDAQSAVCDADGQVFGVHGLFVADASAFPASSGVNPMISIMALAHHTAGCIAARARPARGGD